MDLEQFEVSEESLERAAKAIWDSDSHRMMESAGYATDWASLPQNVKRGVIRKARLAIESAAPTLLAHAKALEAMVEALSVLAKDLWLIIDDIDTYGDMAKSDDKLYRSLVERRQKTRWETGVKTDGYELDFSEIRSGHIRVVGDGMEFNSSPEQALTQSTEGE